MSALLLRAGAIVSLLLCCATVTLWVRSYEQIDFYLWKTATDRNSIGSAYGRIALVRIRGLPIGHAGWNSQRAGKPDWSAYMGKKLSDNVLGFAWSGSVPVDNYQGRLVSMEVASVPDWFLSCLFLSVPLVHVVKRARKRARTLSKKQE